MKAKAIARRLRARSDEFHRMAITFQEGDRLLSDRARLLADVLQEVAEQVSPLTKAEKVKKTKKASGN